MKIYVARSHDIPRGKKIAIPAIHCEGGESQPGLLIVHPSDMGRALFAIKEQGYCVESIQSYFDPNYSEEVFDAYNNQTDRRAVTERDLLD